MSLRKIRPIVMRSNKDIKSDDPEFWTVAAPYDCRQLAIKCYVEALKSAKSNKYNGNIKAFEMKPLDELSSDVIYCDSRFLKNDYRIFVDALGEKSKIHFRGRMRRWLKKFKRNDSNFNIIRDKCNRYYLCVTFSPDIESTVSNCDTIVAIDPGVRTFATTYSQQKCVKYGNGFATMLDKLHKRQSLLTELSVQCTHHKRNNMLRRCRKIRAKIKNKVDNFQWKLAHDLTQEYDIILLPNLRVKKMMEGNPNHNLNRQMQLLSHYKFKQKLLHKAKLIAGKKVIICNEGWTSKTCSKCGTIKNDLGASSIYKCNNCNLSIDRDINGSRNILIRSIAKYYESLLSGKGVSRKEAS